MAADMATKIPAIQIDFVKMHGLGNDFVMIESAVLPSSLYMTTNNQDAISSDFARNILDRRLGIGGDQLITYSMPPITDTMQHNLTEHDLVEHDRVQYNRSFRVIDDSPVTVKMSIYNSDGTKAKACGNASRCMVRLLRDKYKIKQFNLDVDGRILKCRTNSNGKYEVNMGLADFSSSWMPSGEQLLAIANQYNLGPKELICVDVGNPHLVIFSKLSPADMEIIGAGLQKSEYFSDGINVNFANISGNQIKLRVYERGTGFTLACGSGACATFAGAYKLGRLTASLQNVDQLRHADHEKEQEKMHGEVIFDLGSLFMHENNGEITMSGPAQYSFAGRYRYGQ